MRIQRTIIRIKITVLIANSAAGTAAEGPGYIGLIIDDDLTIADVDQSSANTIVIIVGQHIGIAVAAGINDQILGVGIHTVIIQNIFVGGRFGCCLRTGNRCNDLHPAVIGGSHIVNGVFLYTHILADGSQVFHRSQRNGLGRGVDSGVIVQAQRIGRGLMAADIAAVAALGLQVVQTVGAVALHSDLIVLDNENRHGQLVGTLGGDIVPVVIVAGVTCIHIGEVQGLFCPLGSAAQLSNIDLIILGQVNSLAAQVVVIAVGMVMTMHEDDVQTFLSMGINHIKQQLGILAVANHIGTGAECQRQMGNDKNGTIIALTQLLMQPSFQLFSQRSDTGLSAAAVRIIILIHNEDRIAVEIMAAGSINAGFHNIMVALDQNGIVIIDIGIAILYCTHQSRDTGSSLTVVIGLMGLTVVVARKQETVHGVILPADLRQNISDIFRTARMVAGFLEVAACQHVDRRICLRHGCNAGILQTEGGEHGQFLLSFLGLFFLSFLGSCFLLHRQLVGSLQFSDQLLMALQRFLIPGPGINQRLCFLRFSFLGNRGLRDSGLRDSGLRNSFLIGRLGCFRGVCGGFRRFRRCFVFFRRLLVQFSGHFRCFGSNCLTFLCCERTNRQITCSQYEAKHQGDRSLQYRVQFYTSVFENSFLLNPIFSGHFLIKNGKSLLCTLPLCTRNRKVLNLQRILQSKRYRTAYKNPCIG